MEVPRFKLYHFPGSRSARVKWMLHEVLDDDFEVQVVELFQGEHRTDAYRREHGSIADHAAKTHLFVAGIEEEILDFTEGPGAPCLQFVIEQFGRPTDL